MPIGGREKKSGGKVERDEAVEGGVVRHVEAGSFVAVLPVPGLGTVGVLLVEDDEHPRTRRAWKMKKKRKKKGGGNGGKGKREKPQNGRNTVESAPISVKYRAAQHRPHGTAR